MQPFHLLRLLPAQHRTGLCGNYLPASTATLAVSTFTAVLSDTFVVSVTTTHVSQVVGVVDSPPPQDVNTAVKMLSATNVTFFMLFLFLKFNNWLPLIYMVLLSFIF